MDSPPWDRCAITRGVSVKHGVATTIKKKPSSASQEEDGNARIGRTTTSSSKTEPEEVWSRVLSAMIPRDSSYWLNQGKGKGSWMPRHSKKWANNPAPTPADNTNSLSTVPGNPIPGLQPWSRERKGRHNNWRKDPRDIRKNGKHTGPRRDRKTRDRRRKNKTFDSTLGYPGEGPGKGVGNRPANKATRKAASKSKQKKRKKPPIKRKAEQRCNKGRTRKEKRTSARKQRKCFNCGSIRHLARECDKEKQKMDSDEELPELVHAHDVPVQDMTGPSGPILAALPEAQPALDDDRSDDEDEDEEEEPSSSDEEDEQEEDEEEDLDPETLFQRAMRDIEDKINGMAATKNPTKEDMDVIIRAAVRKWRGSTYKGKPLPTLMDDPDRATLHIVNYVHSSMIRTTDRNNTVRASFNEEKRTIPWYIRFYRVANGAGYMKLERERSKWRSLVAERDVTVATEPASVVALNPFLAAIALTIRNTLPIIAIIAKATLEEVAKRAAIGGLRSRQAEPETKKAYRLIPKSLISHVPDKDNVDHELLHGLTITEMYQQGPNGMEHIGNTESPRYRMRLPFTYGQSRLFGVCSTLAAMETARNYQTSPSSIAELVPRTIAHMVLTLLPFKAAVIAHSAVNIFAHFTGIDRRLDITYTGKNRDVLEKVCLDKLVARTPTHDRYVEKGSIHTCIPRFGTRRYFGVDQVVPTVYRSCAHNIHISLDGRVGKKLPVDKMSAVGYGNSEGRWARTNTTINHLIKDLRFVYAGVPIDDWLSQFPAPKRRTFEQVIEKQCEEHMKVPPLAKSFIKAEKSNKLQCAPEYKDPRMIQGCPPSLTIACSPVLKKLVRNFKRRVKPRLSSNAATSYTVEDIANGRHIIYSSGMTSGQIGIALARAERTIQQLCPPDDMVVFLEDDQSRFDLHIRKGAFEALSRFYKGTLPARVCKLLRRGQRTKGLVANGTDALKYTIPYTMQSGWPDTACGDTIINTIMKMEIHGIGTPWISIICGDDSITVTLLSEITKLGGTAGIISSYAAFGMEVKAVYSHDVNDVEFCSGRFMPAGDDYALVPKVGKIIARIGHDMADRGIAGRKAWCRGIAHTLGFLGKQEPLLAALATGLHAAHGDGKMITAIHNPWKVNYVANQAMVQPHQMLSYYDHHYHLNAQDVRELMEVLSRPVHLGHIFTDPRLVMMAKLDL